MLLEKFCTLLGLNQFILEMLINYFNRCITCQAFQINNACYYYGDKIAKAVVVRFT